jgi:hypothetical protein
MKRSNVFLAILPLGILSVTLLAGQALGAVPTRMSYQGFLEDQNLPVSGSRNLYFVLFGSPANPDSIWSESHTNVTIDRGVFNVQLGAIRPLTAEVADRADLYLETRVNGTVLSPRKRLDSVPYALVGVRADSAAYAESAAYAASAPPPPVIIWSGGCSHQGQGGGLITYCNDRTDFNTASEYLTANGLGTFTFLRPGYYRITLQVVSLGNGYASIVFRKNGVVIQHGNEYAGTNWTDNFAEVVWPFAHGDGFQAEVNDPGTIAYESWLSGYSRLQIQYVGPLN